MSNEVILQNLRNFTVKICQAGTEKTVGTGIIVSMAGEVVTCAHVVQAALGKHPREVLGAEVSVYLPQLRGVVKERRATIAKCFPEHDDDVVLLILQDGLTPISPEQIAIMGAADQSVGHEFLSFGYSPKPPYPSSRADGKVLGDVDSPIGKTLLLDPIELKSREIDRGLSGAAVLDTQRNLVVGLIAERWYPGDTPINDDIGWGVDAGVLALDPFNLTVHDTPLAKSYAPPPQVDNIASEVALHLGVKFLGAPEPLPEWVGREDLLKALTLNWNENRTRVAGLIGFGGEGKSSLARKWVDTLLSGLPGCPIPDGVFWWNFYNQPQVDAFFEAALRYMTEGRIDMRLYPSANAKAHAIAGRLYGGRYLFILDGLEVLQHQEGDEYGLLESADLREFVRYSATPGHSSFCLITSRAPQLDLIDFITYTPYDVDRLTVIDGRRLLRQIGVQGTDAALDAVVEEWDGHALTLGLLGSYLVDLYGGDVACIHEIPSPAAEEPRYERVGRVLRRYDERLNSAERTVLITLSAFRTAVSRTALNRVLREHTDMLSLELANVDFVALLERLCQYRILRKDYSDNYTMHPLVRAHYQDILNSSEPAQRRSLHERIARYFQDSAGSDHHTLTLKGLYPLIESVHYECCAGHYDHALETLQVRIYQILTYRLGAWDTAYALLLEFFPNGDASGESPVSEVRDKNWLLNEVGLCLVSLGKLDDAELCFRRIITPDGRPGLDFFDKNWQGLVTAYTRLAELYFQRGRLNDSEESARAALDIAQNITQGASDQLVAFSYLARAARCRGNVELADSVFNVAKPLWSQGGNDDSQDVFDLEYASFLVQQGKWSDAKKIARNRLVIAAARETRSPSTLSKCCRIIGDIYRLEEKDDFSRRYYSASLNIARRLSAYAVLIESLTAHGVAAARSGEWEVARVSLAEALRYVISSGLRLIESNVHLGLAEFHFEMSDKMAATAEAECARAMSADMGYAWGQSESARLLAAIANEGI